MNYQLFILVIVARAEIQMEAEWTTKYETIRKYELRIFETRRKIFQRVENEEELLARAALFCVIKLLFEFERES